MKVKKSKKSSRKTKAKAKAKVKKVKKSTKKVKQNEITAKRSARKVLNNADLYKAYVKLLVIVKKASNAHDKTVKGSAITFWGNRAKAILSANSKEVRLYYAIGQKKRYRENPEQEGTLVFAHSSSLLTEGVQKEISGYLRDIFSKYDEKLAKDDRPKETAVSQVVDSFGEDVGENKDDGQEDEED